MGKHPFGRTFGPFYRGVLPHGSEAVFGWHFTGVLLGKLAIGWLRSVAFPTQPSREDG